MTPAYLVRLIRSHGFPARVTSDGKIRAAMSWGPGAKGFPWTVETIQPNLRAVREWLGY